MVAVTYIFICFFCINSLTEATGENSSSQQCVDMQGCCKHKVVNDTCTVGDYIWQCITHPNTIFGLGAGVLGASFVFFIGCCINGTCKRLRKQREKSKSENQKCLETFEMEINDTQAPVQVDPSQAQTNEPQNSENVDEADVDYADIDLEKLKEKKVPEGTERPANSDYAEIKLTAQHADCDDATETV